MDTVSTKKANAIAAKKAKAKNVTRTASINFHSKKVRDCYILKTVSLVYITIDNNYYYLLLCKKKCTIHVENNEF